ncbi:MAG: hypothetical protein ACI9LX_003459 [Paraglaciecola sp.]|jgi:hypothetical protein
MFNMLGTFALKRIKTRGLYSAQLTFTSLKIHGWGLLHATDCLND